MIMTQDEIMDLLKEKFNMIETRDRGGMRYLRFGEGTQWVVSYGMNQYLLNVREKYEWVWQENRDNKGKLENYVLMWENTNFKMELCDDNSLIYKVGQMHLKWLELEKEIKEKKYLMKLNRIKSDFQGIGRYRKIVYIMTKTEVEECKKYAESKGLKLFHYLNELESEDIIYMENIDDWRYQVCNFFYDTIIMHHIQYNPDVSSLRLSIIYDEVETVDEFKVLLDNRIARYKLCKQELKLNKLKEDF